MKSEEVMTAEEFFGEVVGEKGTGRAGGSRPRKGRAKKTFADIKTRMVMRIYGVTRSKAEKIISEHAVAKAEDDTAVNPAGSVKGRGGDGLEIMSAEEFFGVK